MFKRVLDLSFLIIGVGILLPAFIVIIFLVVLFIVIEDGRPVFYTQLRYGENNKLFKLYKFRSMIKNAEQTTGAVWASKNNDLRLTKTGRFIRKYAIDEIPQLINIFKGDISFVGPRPERPELYQEFSKSNKNFKQRLNAPQGLAGLAQLLGTYATIPRNKLRYDLLYINNQSALLDIKIIILSVLVTVIGNWQTDSRKWIRKFI